MKKRKLFWIVLPPFSIIVLVAVAIIYYWTAQSFRSFYTNKETEELKLLITILEKNWPFGGNLDAKQRQNLCHEWGERLDNRLTLIDPSGKILGDSHEDPSRMDLHDKRPEFIQALSQNIGTSKRYSQTLDTEMVYVAKKIQNKDKQIIVLRLAKPLSEIEQQLSKMNKDNAWIMLGVLLTVFLFVLAISKHISRPIEDILKSVELISQGDLKQKVAVNGSIEVQQLAQAINQMATELSDKIDTILKQKNEQQAAFASMKEGVIALDASGYLIDMNESAKRFLQCQHIDIKGKSLEEVVRNSDFIELQNQIKEVQEIEEDIIVLEPEHKIFQVKGTRIIGPNDKSMIGSLFVINDMTQLRRLELMRTQFVANVSHELKTPLTSIKGYVETLIDSVQIENETANRFLEKISHNANRLHALIEDLLTLSRVEQEGFNHGEVECININRMFESIINELTHSKPEEISFETICDENLKWSAHPLLIHQAVFNLVDNAVKHSNKTGIVTMKANVVNEHLEIEVSDQGQGIDPIHIPHLLERFYRVDKARSRTKGGTGLGLSIVKHITQAHKGHINIKSKIGQGSSFFITIPNQNLTQD